MPDITLENGIVVEGFPDNPTQDDLAKLDRIKKKYQTVSQPTPTSPSDKQRSALGSGMMGISQGATFGLADEAIARLESIRSQYTEKPRSYEDVLQEAKGMYKQASEQNPASYLTGEIGAGVVAPIGQAVTGAKLGRLATIGAGTGALTGFGYSEGQDIGEVARDVGIGTALGGALPVLGRGVQSAIQGVKPAIDTTTKAMITAATGKGSQYLEKLERNPEQIKRMERIFTETAPEEISKLSNQLADVATIDPFAKRALAYSKKSYKILDNAGDNIKIDRSQITDYLNNLSASKIKSTSKVDKFLINEFKEKADDIIQKYPETLNGRDAKRLIQEIDKDTKILLPGRGKQLDKFDSAELKELNKLRSEIDRPLKSQSPEYAESMKPVAEAAELSSLLDRFKVDTFQGRVGDPKLAKNYIDKKLASSKTGLADLRSENETLNKLEKELQRNKYNDIEGIDKLRNLTQTFNDLNLYKELQATGAIGSNITNRYLHTVGGGMAGIGGAIGTTIGGIPGGMIGTGIGGAIGYPIGATLAAKAEKEGGRIAQKLMEKSQNIRTPTAIPEATQRGFAIQQGIQKPLLDQFLSENKRQLETKKRMEDPFNGRKIK